MYMIHPPFGVLSSTNFLNLPSWGRTDRNQPEKKPFLPEEKEWSEKGSGKLLCDFLYYHVFCFLVLGTDWFLANTLRPTSYNFQNVLILSVPTEDLAFEGLPSPRYRTLPKILGDPPSSPPISLRPEIQF
jgi:hypothetical protein